MSRCAKGEGDALRGRLRAARSGRKRTGAAPLLPSGPRLPLSFVIGRYFVYILLCAVVFAGVPTAAFSSYMSRGIIYQANWGANNVEAVLADLAAAPKFDADAIPACYDYAVVDARGARETDAFQSFSDIRAQAVAVARARRDADADIGEGAATGSGAADATDGGGTSRAPGNLMRDGVYYDAVQLTDDSWCVLAYDYMPHWAGRDRAGWINPQDLWLGTMALLTAASVLAFALRASHVLTRKMVPLVDAAEAVGARTLDFPVPRSNVAQVDDVLAAMDRMRADLKAALEEQWETEASHRHAVTQTIHELKTPLTALYGNADLLLEEFDRDPRAFTTEQREELEALRAAVRDADAALLKLIEATRGMTVVRIQQEGRTRNG